MGAGHEFKPLSQADARKLLRERWWSAGVSLCDDSLIDEEALAMLIRGEDFACCTGC
jgi:hypothetical protein